MPTAFTRTDTVFESSGIRCAAWLYIPKKKTPAPVVVMAHGFAGVREFRLDAFAEKFAARGLASFVFDYRGFGTSEGEPRQLVDPKKHLEDWAAAIAHVRSLQEVDGARLALWGTSFSGGHVLVTAARIPGIKCVVAQVPFVDGLASTGVFGPALVLQALGHALRDALGAKLGMKPHEVPVVGRPSEFALMNTPDAMDAFEKLVPPGAPWVNRTPARIVLNLPRYRPIESAPKITCPVLLVAAEKDSLIPLKAVERTARRIPRCEFVRKPIAHFEIYTGEEFEKASALEAEFLCRHLEA